MKFKHTISILLVSTFLASTALAAVKPIAVQTVVHSNKSWNGAKLMDFMVAHPDVYVEKYTIQPGAKVPIHLHPVLASGYVIAGQLTMFATSDENGDFSNRDSVKKIILEKGEGWVDTINTWHYGINNGNEPVEMVMFFISQKNTPTAFSLTKFK